jgi:hypothetical protein
MPMASFFCTSFFSMTRWVGGWSGFQMHAVQSDWTNHWVVSLTCPSRKASIAAHVSFLSSLRNRRSETNVRSRSKLSRDIDLTASSVRVVPRLLSWWCPPSINPHKHCKKPHMHFTLKNWPALQISSGVCHLKREQHSSYHFFKQMQAREKRGFQHPSRKWTHRDKAETDRNWKAKREY